MVTEVVMTVWIRLVQGSEKVKDQDVDEAHGSLFVAFLEPYNLYDVL